MNQIGESQAALIRQAWNKNPDPETDKLCEDFIEFTHRAEGYFDETIVWTYKWSPHESNTSSEVAAIIASMRRRPPWLTVTVEEFRVILTFRFDIYHYRDAAREILTFREKLASMETEYARFKKLSGIQEQEAKRVREVEEARMQEESRRREALQNGEE
jgi:hypothetical protein